MGIMEVRTTKKRGRGVFTLSPIKKGDDVLLDHVVILRGRQYLAINKTDLSNYYFDWYGTSFVALGVSSFLNHSDTPNLDWSFSVRSKQIRFLATRDIAEGEELMFDYGWDWYPWRKQLHSGKKKVKSVQPIHTTPTKKRVPKNRK